MRKVDLVQGEFYHIFNRGNSKQIIFKDQKDYERFVRILFIANSENNFKFRDALLKGYSVDRGNSLVSIGAWCLMPNHFHLLIKENGEGGISKFMQKLTTAYSMYFNTKYSRTGGLFEGRFKSAHIDDDRYLKYIFSYINLNPVKLIDSDWKEKGIKNKKLSIDFLYDYKFSSFLDYLGIIRKESAILDQKSFPKYFPTGDSFKSEILEWINFEVK
ncbi:MAG: transposase [Minisyncoccota bacterium]